MHTGFTYKELHKQKMCLHVHIHVFTVVYNVFVLTFGLKVQSSYTFTMLVSMLCFNIGNFLDPHFCAIKKVLFERSTIYG